MTKKTCLREPEVVAAVLADCLSDELRTHVATCSLCGEVARVVTLVHDDYVDVQHQASLPTADVVWPLSRTVTSSPPDRRTYR